MNVNKLINALILMVIGLALLPVVQEFTTDLTEGTEPVIEGTMATLVDLLPVLYVIIIVVGAVSYVATKRN